MSGKTYLRTILASTVSVFALATAAVAQNADSTESVVVTGTRIQNGNELPTPVTVVSAEQLQVTTPSSIPDGLNKLPVFNTTSTPNNAAQSNGRGFGAPGNFLNMRTLGAIRTLILQDGRRVPGTFYDTTVDTDMLPQMLIQRVDVVTGGASAVYGSDAVSGVVNFVTDTHFNGFKGLLQGGTSTYNDRRSLRAGFAWGADIFNRGHLELTGEYTVQDAVTDSAARPYGAISASVQGAGTAASPFILGFNARQSNAAPGGLVTTTETFPGQVGNGPFAGQQFQAGGALGAYNPGTPTPTANIATGGDGGWTHNLYILPVVNKGQMYGRFDYDVSDDIHAFVEARYSLARSYMQNQTFTNTPTQYPITIYSGNAFLTPAQQAAMNASGTQYFNMNRFDWDFAKDLGVKTHTGALAMTAGVDGKAWGDWTWDAYYTHAETRTQDTTLNNINSARFYAALDAVKDPATGNTVCNVSLTAPGAFPGCVPLNLMGENSASAAAKAYVRGTTYWVAHNGLDDFGANLTGTLFEGWAGPIKAAVGAEYRLASLGVDTTTTAAQNAFNAQYLRLAPFGTYNSGNNGTAATNPFGSYPSSNLAWFKEVQAPSNGSENVTEGNVELDVPLLKDLPLIQSLAVSGAYRYTQYSASGNGVSHSDFSANTWRVGVEWQLFDDLKVRATRSRDIRAPTLWDLYQQQVISTSGISDPLTGVAGSANTVTGGNPALKPEVARNTTAGVVYTPGWFTGFSASFDYFHVAIDNAIGAVNGLAANIQALCLASPGGSSPYCGLVQRPISYNSTAPGNFPTLIFSLNQNIAQIYAEGADIEANYQTEMSAIVPDWQGSLSARFLFTHQHTLKTISTPGAQITNAAGTQTLPVDKWTLALGYNLDRWNINLLERYDSPIRQSANPAQIFNIPDVAEYFQTDVTVSYDFDVEDVGTTAFLSINNLFNAKGGIYSTSGFTGSPGLLYPQAPYADLVGRYFTVGVRFRN